MKFNSRIGSLILTATLAVGMFMIPPGAHANTPGKCPPTGCSSSSSSGTGTASAPELDPSFAAGALTLLGFGLAAVRGRSKRK